MKKIKSVPDPLLGNQCLLLKMEAGPFSQHSPAPPGLCQAPEYSEDRSPALQDPVVLKGNPKDTMTPLKDLGGCAQEPGRSGSITSSCIIVT